MAVIAQEITDDYAIYNADCMEVLPTLPDEKIHFSIYSPPFCGLYQYSSSERDFSNSRNYDEFFEHYEFLVREIERVTMPGRCTAVHCMDVPSNANAGGDLTDFPGDIIRLHKRLGFKFRARYHVWKEPLGVRNRTMAKGLAHKQIVDDSVQCDVANGDYVLVFQKKGDNPVPVAHPEGLTEYAGADEVPRELWQFKNWTGKQTENRYSHWIWRRYASSIHFDVRIDNVLPYEEARDPDDERHVHPLQLDVIHRHIVLRTNPGETVLTPFMGVGSEVYEAVRLGRKAVGIELKTSYYKQALRNMSAVTTQELLPMT